MSLSYLLQFDFRLALRLLLLDDALELVSLKLSLLLKALLFLDLLKLACFLQLMVEFHLGFSLAVLLLARLALVLLHGTLGAECVELGLAVVGLLLHLAEPLYFSFLLVLEAPIKMLVIMLSTSARPSTRPPSAPSRGCT